MSGSRSRSGRARGARVQKRRDSELASDPLGQRPSQRHAVVHRDVAHRDEGDDVGGAHTRMLARVSREVDPLSGDGDGAKGRGDRGIGRGDEREDRAMVRGVGLDVEKVDAGDAGERSAERVQRRLIAAFREVRHTFDQR